jgi:hypothetical protein
MALTSLWFIPTLRRNIMAKRNRKRNVDVKAAAANDKTLETVQEATSTLATAVVEREATKPPKHTAPATPQAHATATGAGYAKLAGRPSKQAVTAVFETAGYAKSWVQRAVILGITPEELCEQFKTDPEGLKVRYAGAIAKNFSSAVADVDRDLIA